MASAAGFPALTGALAFAAVAFGIGTAGCVLLLRPDPGAGVNEAEPRSMPVESTTHGIDWSSPVLAVALTAMMAGQFVLVMIQTMTPIYMGHTGVGLGAVGAVMSSHVLGMYALAPLAGWLSDRAGPMPVITAGLVILACATVAGAVVPAGNVASLAAVLFLLGLGWSVGFVSASGLLTRGASLVERAHVQGAADTLVFIAAALASVGSGVLMSAGGFATLCLSASTLVVVPLVVVARNRGAVRLVLSPQS
jgi:MFS family permease